MTIDLKYTLPAVLPFVVLGVLRLLWWAAGAPWSEPGLAAFMACAVGTVIGVLMVAFMNYDSIKWTVRIGGKRDD